MTTTPLTCRRRHHANPWLLDFALRLLDAKAKLLIEAGDTELPEVHVFTRMQLRLLPREIRDRQLRDQTAVRVMLDHLTHFGVTACEAVMREFRAVCANTTARQTVVRAFETAAQRHAGRTVRIFRKNAVALALHIFAPRAKSRVARPAILSLFGGGWYLGKPEQFFEFCEYFAKRGYVAISADYRTKGRDNVPPVEGFKDVKSAIRHVRAHAEELGIDPRQLCVCGWSAGAHLAIAAATIRAYEHPDDDARISCRPDTVIMLAPGLDVNTSTWFAYVNGTSVSSNTLWPLRYIKKGLPPTLTIVGTEDGSVDFRQIESFTRKMRRAGNRVALHVLEGVTHTGILTTDTCRKIEAFLKKTQ